MSTLRSNLFLTLAAVIWGLAFVAQRVGMDYVGPFTFNGVRFALGALSLLPLLFYFKNDPQPKAAPLGRSTVLWAGLVAGLLLFSGASLQQVGLIYTTAGKAAFITCLYIILVPIAGLWLKQRVDTATWLGALLALSGLYLLCVKEGFSIAFGDLLQLIGAVFWTGHILWIDHFSKKVNVFKLCFVQFITCSALSLTTAALCETITLSSLQQAIVPILYGGFFSVGIAYTLQVVGQRHASPAHAALILSLETVFAALGGYLLLDEKLGRYELLGCALMLAGMLLSQLKTILASRKQDSDLLGQEV
ncbi:DMT family transporter [Azotosporobacter soli]|uniref:DMT family transporter n=1 Tax=Azotosporobacter soli TaxID=3055040 RepID=UPI0031FE8A62